MKKLPIAAAVCILLAISVLAKGETQPEEKVLPRIADKTRQMRPLAGFFPLYWDERQGKIWLEISRWDTEFLYLDSLPAGIGSNDIGLDRGQLGEGRVVKFQRVGPKVLLVQVNYSFRASSQNPAEQRAVADAFAQSVLWGFEVAAEDSGSALVDATPFFLNDAHHVAETLKQTKQGTFRVEPSRSALYLANTKNFPQNTEVEATLTFVGDEPGKFVQDVTPDPRAITVREHYSLVQLPDGNYRPREFDPRAGFYATTYQDYSAPIGATFVKQFIARHRLQKKDPTAAVSEPVKPIVYYLDPGAPQPIRSALLEGAGWWNQAFEAAGYRNAFRVEMLPPDVDPLDVRYNVIEWVHRYTRGWSYGSTVVDPRTGEIIQGHVSLGSLRAHQDYLILEGLLSPHKKGQPDDPHLLQTVLARLRQLSAHEVGHTLGLMHNYIASTEGRASVMDYPHPLVKIGSDGSLDLSDAYATGIGEWDKVAIQYGYSDFAPGTDEKTALNEIIQKARMRGLIFLTDQDARPPGSAHPQTHLWDNGKNAVDELERVLAVRARALDQFSEAAIREGAPMALLEDTLVPVYLFHRYQTEAAVKVIGGQTYTYALRGDGQTPTTPVPAAEQRRALDTVLKTIAPETLAVPDRIAALIPPHPAGYERTRESFNIHTGMTFDPLAAAETAAHQTISLLLEPERAARLVSYHGQDPSQLGLGEVLDRLLAATWKSKASSDKLAAVQRSIADVALNDVMALAANEHAATEVRAMAWLKLMELKDRLTAQAPSAGDEQQRAHLLFAAAQIRRFEQEPAQVLKSTDPLAPPPGAPIGSLDGDDLDY
ncbi:MAG: zinc-dependent metalloprotease [Acidobacteriia bacterium]|nr:zinc-dependent metalloprotease [Terriglobia bacterium]